MASADFLRFVVTMLRFEFVYSYAPARPPRVSVITFTSYICCIYALNFGQYRTLFCLANSSISKRLFFMQFLFVRPRFCLRLLSDSASRRTPLSLANSSYCHACSGLSPPSYCACRAHKRNWTPASILIVSKLVSSYGGGKGIRTLVRLLSNGFQDRLVMTTSISLRINGTMKLY